MSTRNICFCGEIRKIFSTLLARAISSTVSAQMYQPIRSGPVYMSLHIWVEAGQVCSAWRKERFWVDCADINCDLSLKVSFFDGPWFS